MTLLRMMSLQMLPRGPPSQMYPSIFSLTLPQHNGGEHQESNPEDCEVENWAEGRPKCLPEAQNIEEDSVNDDEAQKADPERNDMESVDKYQIIHVPPEAEIEEIGSEEEIENLSERLKILRS